MARTVRTGGNELAALTGESRYLHGRSVATVLFSSAFHSLPLDTHRAALLGLSFGRGSTYMKTRQSRSITRHSTARPPLV